MNVAAVQPLPTVAARRPSSGRTTTTSTRSRTCCSTDPRLGATPTERYNKVMLGGLRVVHRVRPRRRADRPGRGRRSTLPDTRFTAALAAMDPQQRRRAGDRRRARASTDVAVQPGHDAGPVRPPARLDVQGDRARDRARERLLGEGLDRRHLAVHAEDQGPARCDPANPIRTRNAEGSGGVQSLRSATRELGELRVLPARRRGRAPQGRRDGEASRGHPPAQPANYSLSIGSSDGVSPLDMATVFATFAADGVRHDPIFIKKVEDSDGKVIFENKGEGVRAIDPQIARTVTDVLRGVITNGTGKRAKLYLQVAAGKTGHHRREAQRLVRRLHAAARRRGVDGRPRRVHPDAQRRPARRGLRRHVPGDHLAEVHVDVAGRERRSRSFIPPDQSLWPAGSLRERERSQHRAGRAGPAAHTSTTRPAPFFGVIPGQPPRPPVTPPPTDAAGHDTAGHDSAARRRHEPRSRPVGSPR